MGTNITGIGNANAIGFKSRVTGGTYFPPELKDALVGVWSAYGKSNDSTDRNIIKNKIKDRGGDFVISNAAFKLNSGFGKYEEDFTSWDRIDASTAEISNDGSKIKCINTTLNVQYLFNSINRDIPSFKVKISNFTKGNIAYYYRKEDGTEAFLRIEPSPLDKVLELPKSYNTVEGGTGSRGGFYSSNINIGVTIEQIPSFEGAFVTDGIDDLITSTKTVQEMLGGSNEITVVSMIHGIGSKNAYTNVLRESGSNYIRNTSTADGKTGIYGYTSKDTTKSIITDILGDKKDYKLEHIQTSTPSTINSVFSVAGWRDSSFSMVVYPIAWYWTIIANKVLTTDEINQVIAYFNLDKTLKPDILCNITKQGITNDNHADFNNKLIDYSGNGRDIQMYNLAWKGGSGIAAKKFETIKDYNIIPDEGLQELTIYNEFSFKIKSIRYADRYWAVQSLNKTDMSYPVTIITDKDIIWRNTLNYTDADGVKGNVKKETNVPANTPTQVFIYGFNDFDISDDYTKVNCVAYATRKDITEFTVTFIPSCKGGLLLDGVNDFGKVTGMPVYKDYTVVADREIIDGLAENADGGVALKGSRYLTGAFCFDYKDAAFSFGTPKMIPLDTKRFISYQSKYVSNGISINIGTATDNDELWIGRLGNDERYSKIAIRFLMSFPYSMSEFLIERQLKKHKLGTLYPDMVEFRPVIKSNASYDNIVFYYKNEKVENGTYLTVGSSIGMHIRLSSSPVNEIKSITVNGIPATFKYHDANNNIYQYDFNLTSKSPQKINITIDEYIRFEDIVQPYPVLLRFNDENGNEVSWGDKIKVGSSITRIGSAADSNLLPNIYNIFGLLLNGNQVTSSKVIVEKTMVFKAKSAYIFDNNEPKCILSPRLLRIPNSSYKILGHIPDISGHGNHGKINNSAYALASGANGYPYDYNNSSFWADNSLAKVVSGELVEYFAVKNSTGFSNITSGVYKGEIKVTGVTKAISENKISRLRIYTNSTTDNELIDITQDGNYNIDIKGVDDANRVFFYAIPSNPNDTAVVRLTEPIYIEQVGNYEGSICFDGVDDYVDIPSLSIGGKQVLMKTNWLKSPTLLYDQRASGSFAILTTKEDDATNPRIAYQARNQDGKTYIDGIENNYIETYSLKGITHNITVTNPSAGSGVVPVIGANTGKSSSFAKMALYDFMLFDEVSTDEEIKQLNDIVGIEGGYVQKPPYYWDAYGKTNSDDDRSTIQQRGTAVGDYDITNYNHAYEGMSGYNGYPAVFGTNKTYANLVPNDGNFILTSSHNIINVTKFDTSYGLLYSHIKLDGKLTSRNIDYPSYKIKVTGLGENFGLHYSYLESSSDTTVKGFEINNDGIYIIPKSFASDGSLTSNSNWIGFIFTGTAPESCNVTIEVLPEYENGLVYDGVDDYSENTSIPAFTDYTYIIKYEDFNNPNTGSCIQRKGSIKAGGGAFVQDHIYRGTKYQYNFGISSNIHKDDSIAFCTKTNYNGTAIPSGNNTDDTGFTIGKFDGYRKMVFYKEMLYPRTVNMLTINMIKNMMAEDGIIDIQGKLFTDKFTGDFNLDFNKDFLIGN